MIWEKQMFESYCSTSFKASKAKCAIKSSMHNHCAFCDGANSPKEMAKAAYELGLTDFGFSSHGAPNYPPYIGVDNNSLQQYLSTIFEIKQQYRGKMRVYTGIEQDYYAPVDFRDKLDYLIGAVHDIYDKKTGKSYFVDGDLQTLKLCINEVFNGDALALCKHFYELTAENAIKYKPDIIAHFDIIVKNNVNNMFFDEESSEYKSYALLALHECMKIDTVFELNTGGVYRGYRNDPYPAMFLLKEMCNHGARVTISSDSHSTKSIGFMAKEAKAILRQAGFKYIYEYENGEFAGKIL